MVANTFEFTCEQFVRPHDEFEIPVVRHPLYSVGKK